MNDEEIGEIEEKLLRIRRFRQQPLKDDKILCGINALLAMAMLQAGRYLMRPELEQNGSDLVQNLIDRFWDGKTLMHSSYNGVMQKESFLFDAASILTAITMLSENNDSWENYMNTMIQYLETFKDGDKWRESWAVDFHPVYASWSDHPVPSSISLAEMGLTRASLLSGKEIHSREYREPFITDFHNISVMINNGQFHLFESEKILSWNVLPVNSIRIYGNHETDCFMGTCRPIEKRYFQE
jgi:hypothetical protein